MRDLDTELEGVAAGDVQAFTRWLAEAERPLRLSLRTFAASVDTEAVVQEALLRAWQVAPRVRRDGKSNTLLRLTFRMAHNLAVSEARRLRTASRGDANAEVHAALDEEAALNPPRPPDPFLREAIEDCQRRLPEQPARALRARLDSRGQRGDAELAERVRMRLNTFLQNVTRARKLLVECLRHKGIELEPALFERGAR